MMVPTIGKIEVNEMPIPPPLDRHYESGNFSDRIAHEQAHIAPVGGYSSNWPACVP